MKPDGLGWQAQVVPSCYWVRGPWLGFLTAQKAQAIDTCGLEPPIVMPRFWQLGGSGGGAELRLRTVIFPVPPRQFSWGTERLKPDLVAESTRQRLFYLIAPPLLLQSPNLA